MEWVYNNHSYYTEIHSTLIMGIPSLQDLKNLYKSRFNIATKDGCFLVYHTKWDKVYKLISLQRSGNRFAQITAYLEDIYTGKKYYTSSTKLEFVYHENNNQ